VRNRAVVLASVWICAAAAPPLQADQDGARFAALLRDAAPAIVTVRVVTKTTVQMGARSTDRESRIEIPGVVVDPGGLIMTSIMPFAPELLLRALSRGDEERMPQLKTVPSEIKVLFEQDENENDAFLAATDSNLGLAFLQIEDLAGRKLKAVDFSHAANPAVGDVVAAVSRLGKGYDSTPYFDTARISGEIGKPRKAWVTDHGLSTLGLPIFSPAGQVLGVLAMVDSGLAESQSSLDGSFGMMMQIVTGGGGMIRPFIVPAPAVAAVIEQARQQAAHKVAERAAKKAVPAAPGKPGNPGKT
jgi:S1-C subfamily serine protease